MFIGCRRLRELVQTQRSIIERHIDRHKWFLHIEDPQEAIADFIEKFGWVMREFHCTQICEDRAACEAPAILTGQERLPYAPPQLRAQHAPLEREELLRCASELAAKREIPLASVFSMCKHLDRLLESQADIIARHMERHMWFRHIENRDEALKDFIREFGWVMRELYCGHLCVERFDCGAEPAAVRQSDGAAAGGQHGEDQAATS